MIEALPLNGLISAFLAGIVLGVFFFGGLWWTLQKLISSRRAALWVSASMLFRTSVTLLGFYFVGHGSWKRMLTCLFGFLIARFVIFRLSRKSGGLCESKL